MGCGGVGPRLTDAVLGLEDLIVVFSILDLCSRLPLVSVILTAGAASLTLRVLLHPAGHSRQEARALVRSGLAPGTLARDGPTSCVPHLCGLLQVVLGRS